MNTTSRPGRPALWRALGHVGLALVLLLSQSACVSTGPQRLQRDQAAQIQPGEAITLTLQDGSRVGTRYLGRDDKGINTSQGHFAHARIRHLEVERFSAGETLARTTGLFVALGLVGSLLMARALRDSLDDAND